jgi:hypothetical protein
MKSKKTRVIKPYNDPGNISVFRQFQILQLNRSLIDSLFRHGQPDKKKPPKASIDSILRAV